MTGSSFVLVSPTPWSAEELLESGFGVDGTDEGGNDDGDNGCGSRFRVVVLGTCCWFWLPPAVVRVDSDDGGLAVTVRSCEPPPDEESTALAG